MKNTIPKLGERVPRAVEFVPLCNSLLDVGCENGIIEYFLRNKVRNIYGIDNSKKALKIAKKRGLKTKHVDFDKERFPFSSNFFDVVTCLDVIEHVKDPKRLLKEIYRVVKKGGKVIIATPNIRFTNHIFELLIKGKFPKTSMDTTVYDGGHLHFFTYKDLIDLLVNTGFVIDKVEGIINKPKRGFKGQILELILGKNIMLEFRAPGILLKATK